MNLRPQLTLFLNCETFKNYYYKKSELVAFCRQNNLAQNGLKQALTKRIYIFLSTGKKTFLKAKSCTFRDSDLPLQKTTYIKNYVNDLKTRMFFKKHLGSHFHFTVHLMRFIKENVGEKLTYGDLIEEWKKEHKRKKDPNHKRPISKSCEYNQFFRDFFSKEKGRSRKDAIQAWYQVRSFPGPNTYEYYLLTLRTKSNS
ncbi:MAG: hypothetical protein K940chlam8_00924 [Chlamydiae bacterium]|nr:hypothetical protein [Chlamydiota bacterium]